MAGPAAGWLFALAATAAGPSDEVPPTPPDAPAADEIVLKGNVDSVAIKCATFYTTLVIPDRTTLRVVVTMNKDWGTVWRADYSVPLGDGEPPMLWRFVCSEKSMLLRPLEMFDPAQSIPPLK